MSELKPIERRIGDMWEDASYEWGEACGGPAVHEIFALKIISAMRQELSPDPESVPIPTTVNMARMMLGLGYNYLESHAPEHLAASTIPASEAGERKLYELTISKREQNHDAWRVWKARAALASTRTASNTRTAAGDAEWGAVHTVGDMVRNLLTFDQSDPIHAAFHVDYEGERRCRTRPVSISRERVIDGKWVDPARKDVPYAVIVWAKQDERTASTDAATRSRAEGGNTQPVSVESGRPAEVDVEAERPRFEAFARSEACPMLRDGEGYKNARTQTFWTGWLAARTQADAGKAAALREAVGRLIKAKGRFHTEQNYKAVVAAYDATTKPENT